MRDNPSANQTVSDREAVSSSPTLEHQVIDGLRVSLKPAPPMRRFLALCCDLGLISIATYALLFVFILVFVFFGFSFAQLLPKLGGGLSNAALGGGLLVVIIVGLLAILSLYHVYFIYFEYKTMTTPGKKLFGLKVISVDGARLSLGQTVIRELLRTYIDIPLVLPALISIFSTEKKQRIGDLAANTMVIHSHEREERDKFLYVKQEEYHLLMEYLKPGSVPADFREAYLKFAYGEFIARNVPAPAQHLEDWSVQIKRFLPDADRLGLNQQTVLRFFAEYCFQAANQKTADKS